MESRLLEILVCPLCKGPLRHDREQQELICKADKLAFPIRDGIPVMLEHEARSEEHTSELQSLMRISYAVFCLKKKKNINHTCDKYYHTKTQHQNTIP